MEPTTFVGLEVHKRMPSVAIAEAGRGGEVRFLGEIPSSPEALHRLALRLKGHHRRLSFCYEAGPCGYGVHRRLRGLGQECIAVSPSDHAIVDRPAFLAPAPSATSSRHPAPRACGWAAVRRSATMSGIASW